MWDALGRIGCHKVTSHLAIVTCVRGPRSLLDNETEFFFLSLGVYRPGREADRSTPFGDWAKIPLLSSNIDGVLVTVLNPSCYCMYHGI